MEHAEIYRKLTPIFRDILDLDDLVLAPEMTAAEVPGWDSFNHVNLVVASEVAFKIKFKSGEIEELKNVGEFVSLIAQKSAPRPS
jgi:acyl carrier protein